MKEGTLGTSWRQCEVEVVPGRVGFLDQVEFPAAGPVFDVLLALDRGLDRAVHFVPDEHVDAVARRESVAETPAMFPGAPGAAVCSPSTQGGGAGAWFHVYEVCLYF